MFEHLYRSMTSQSYKQDLLKLEIPEAGGKKGKKDKKSKKKEEEDEALSVA